ncbi:hypothetical protein PG991_009117 [Apiospora marii]|uniref:ATP-dependent DNA helicase n=1 Tax=Apiospora marii TaxID=335849 RepID=A0ABR1RJS1_9PEZI
MLSIDEISQVGGLTLASVDSRLRQHSDDPRRLFGDISIVLISGDVIQFDPVKQTNFLLVRPENLTRHIATRRLFQQFTTVVIRRDQVRAARHRNREPALPGRAATTRGSRRPGSSSWVYNS